MTSTLPPSTTWSTSVSTQESITSTVSSTFSSTVRSNSGSTLPYSSSFVPTTDDSKGQEEGNGTIKLVNFIIAVIFCSLLLLVIAIVLTKWLSAKLYWHIKLRNTDQLVELVVRKFYMRPRTFGPGKPALCVQLIHDKVSWKSTQYKNCDNHVLEQISVIK